tara:strand:+ start:87 stop:707 length:621 start_codon:yes stop_codon:yes gene_type:complete
MEININDENFFYQESAEDIVDSIIDLFEQGVTNFESYEQWPYTKKIVDEDEDVHHFNWYLDVARSDSKDFVYSLFGLAGRDFCDEPSITVTIVLPKGKHQKSVKLKRHELFDVVSHELHHLAQNIENNHQERKSDYSGKLSYLMDPYEIEAFHIGIRAHSALSDKSFEEIAEDYIRSTWSKGTQDQIITVVQAWKNTDFQVFNKNK